MAKEFSLEEALGRGTKTPTEFSLEEALGTPAPAPQERTIGESIKDVGAGLVSGLGSIVQVPGQLYGLATGDFSDRGLLGVGQDISEYGEEMKSAGLKAREAERARAVEAASQEGQFAAFKTALGQTITDPALLTTFLAEQAPQVIPMILAGGGAGYIASRKVMSEAAAKGAAMEAAKKLASQRAVQAGTTAAIQTGAVMQGSDVGAGAYDDIVAGLIDRGATPEEAAEEAINKARAAGLTGYALSVLANRYLPGGKALEEILAGKKLTGSVLGSAAVTGLKEIPSENIEEVGGRIAQNIAVRSAGLDRDIMSGTGEAAAMATIGAAGIGGAAGALSRKQEAGAEPETPEAVAAFERDREQFVNEFGEAEAVQPGATELDVETLEPAAAAPVEPPVELPGGFTVARREVARQEVPEAFGIFQEGSGKPLVTVGTPEEAEMKLESLTQIRQEEQQRLRKESEKIDNALLAERRKIEVMEATGQTDTDQYVQAKAMYDQKQQEAAETLTNINNQIESYFTPLTFAPIGRRTEVQNEFVVNRGEEPVGVFPSFEAAQSTVEQLAPEAFKQAEQARVQKRIQDIDSVLRPAFAKFNLGDVGLNIVEAIKTDTGGLADGAYARNLIQIAVGADEPLQTMRHETVHALKELQFFTPQQWKVLTERANKDWLVQLKKMPYEEGVSRYDAYLDMFTKDGQRKGLQGPELEQYANEALIEESIADAFGAYSRGATPPPGMIAALFKKLKNFFANFGQALRGAGFESADDIFQRIERGELKSRKPKKAEAPKKAEEETIKPEQTMGQRLSLLRKAYPDEIDISTQNPQGVKRIYDPITEMLSIDEKAVREAMEANPEMGRRTIQAIKSYGFVPENTPDDKVLEVFKANIINNLLFLHDKVPAKIRKRSKLWYDGANKIAKEMAKNNDMSLRQVSAILAAMSPQKDWFQNVSMAERAIDILKNQGDRAWTPDMLKYAESYVKESKDRKEREKRQDAFEKIKKVAESGTVLNDMDEKSAAAFVRAYDEAFHSRDYRIVTPEGGFGGLVTKANGQPATMMWSTYGPIEKTVSIFRDGSRENVSEQLGFEHKIRSFYNNIANPNSEIDHVTIDTHAVAAALFEALAGTDTEVKQNFGGTGSSDVLGVGGTYGLIAEAYREAAKLRGIRAREMQSITWEAIRALFNEDIKSTIKPKIRTEWKKYRTGQQSFDATRTNVMKIAGQPETIDPPDWIDSGSGQFVVDGGASYDKSFKPAGGVRLREERELRERLTFNLSAVTSSIPGLKELYTQAMRGDTAAYELLQKVAESSLQYLLKGTGARAKIEYVKGVYLADREPSISVSVAFDERNQQVVMGALAKFADNYNQQQIHVRTPTIRNIGHDFGDGSYATPVYEFELKDKLDNEQISDIINQTGLQGFSVSEREVVVDGKKTSKNFLTTYWVAPNDIDTEFESFDRFSQASRAAYELAGREGQKPKQTVERLYVYGKGPGARIRYQDIQGDLLPSEGTDSVTPRLIAEYLQGEPVKVFKQKDLTNKQVEGQKLLAKVFDDLPTKDLKNPLVRKAYEALNKELVRQYNVMPIKVKLVEGERGEDGKIIDIYKNSAQMRKDVSENNRFKVFKTEPGTFGPTGFDFKDHPLLKDSGLKDAGNKPMLFNDVLRAVHDYYAHNLSDVQFGPKGEAAAWRNHMSVTRDPMARWALTAETRAQNAWQNFRDGVEDIPLKDRPFADQKAALPPVNFTFTGESDVDQIMTDYVATLTPEQRLGSLPADSQYADAVQKQMPKYSLRNVRFPSVKAVKEAVAKTSVPETPEFKRFIAGNQWVDEDGKAAMFYHATSDEFLEFTPFGNTQAIYLSRTPEESEVFGRMAEDRRRKKIYELLNKDQKLELFQRVLGEQVKKGGITEEQVSEFIRDAKRKAPEYGKFGDFDKPIKDALLELSPARMSIMPLWVRAETPFDFRNPDHVAQVAAATRRPDAKISEVNRETAEALKAPTEYPDEWYKGLPGNLKQGFTKTIEQEPVQAALHRLGFDGYISRQNRTSPLNYAVYNPTQLKSVTDNSGEFDREAKNISYSLRAPKTPEFKQWFGDSKIVDAEGRPLVMYHGTSKDVEDFTRKEKRGTPIFLTSDPRFADRFAMDSVDVATARVEQVLTKEQIAEGRKIAIAAIRKDYRSLPEGKVMIDSIKTEDYSKATPEAKEYLRNAYKEMMPSGPNVLPVYVSAQNPFDYENPSHVQKVVDELNKTTDEYGRKIGDLDKGFLARGGWELIESKRVQDAIIKLGFDGFYVKEDGRKNIAVYESGQVKSALSNVGTYDRNDPRIRYSLPPIPQGATDRINETTTVREEKNFAKRIVEAISPQARSYFRAASLNRYNQASAYDKLRANEQGGAVLLADQSAESAALMSDVAAGVAASAMGTGNRTGGIPVLRNGITTIDSSVKGMVAALAPLAVYGDPKIYRRYQYWAMVKRGVRLNAQGKQVGITTADVAYAKMLEKMHPEFVSVQKDLIAFNNGLVKYMIDTGVLSKERGAEYVKYADYVPFYRQMDGEKTLGPSLFQSLSGVRPPKQLKGGDAPLADFLETMVRNTAAAIQAGAKNYAAQRMINVVTDIKNLPPGMGATRLAKASTSPHVINVLENGELVSYETPDSLLLYAMKSLNQSELPFMSIISGPADMLRNLVTRDPGFMMANLLRDSLSAYVTSGKDMTPVVDTVINFGKALGNMSPTTRKLLDAGVISGYDTGNIEESGRDLEEDLARKAGKRRDSILFRPFTSVWEALEKGTTASDAATRAVIYDRVLAETGNEAEALYRALEVMNFHRKGGSALVRVLTAAVPFFNARLQGLDLFYRASTGNMNTQDAAAVKTKFWARGATMMALSGLYWFLVSDDEEYKKQEQETKDNNWLFPGLGFRIPTPFEVGFLFKTVPERIAEFAFGDDTGKDFAEAMQRGLVSTFAFNPMPQTFKPIWEAYTDKSSFTGRSIVGEGLKDVVPEYQIGPSTSKTAIAVGQTLGLSPMKVDHVIKGYTGTMGMYLIDTIDAVANQFSDVPSASKRFEQMPIIKRFSVDAEARGSVTQYYQLKDSVDTVVRTMNLLEKTGESEAYVEYVTKNRGTLAFKDYIRDTEKTMTELRSARRAIRASAMSGDEKRDALLEISRAESQITSQIQRIKQAIASIQ